MSRELNFLEVAQSKTHIGLMWDICRKRALLGVWVDVGYFVLACHVRRSQKDLPLVWIG